MNKLVLHRIKLFMKKYSGNIFDQDDVMTLLVDLRDTSAKNSIARELGDFLAHPHLRDQGLSWKLLNKTYNDIQDKFRNIIDGSESLAFLDVLCTEMEIIESISLAVESTGINSGFMKKPTNDQRAKDFILCVVGLLSSCTLKITDNYLPLILGLGRGGSHLVVSANVEVKQDGKNLAVCWPILSTSCRISNEDIVKLHPWGELENFVARRDSNNVMVLRRLETDNEIT
jgi:hypothetical protein